MKAISDQLGNIPNKDLIDIFSIYFNMLLNFFCVLLKFIEGRDGQFWLVYGSGELKNNKCS